MKLHFILFSALAVATSVSAGGNSSSSFPRYLSMVASQWTHKYWSDLDIIRGDSQRGPDGRLHLAVLAHDQGDLDRLKTLEQEGHITLGSSIVEEQNKHRELQFGSRGPQDLNDLPCYRTVQNVLNGIETMEREFPDFVSVEVIGQTYLKTQSSLDGFDIPVVKITNKKSNKKKAPVMITGGMHPRELAPPELLMRFIEMLLNDYGSKAEVTWILDRTEFHVIPIVNLDTRFVVQSNLPSMMRKNRHNYGCNRSNKRLEGVDLNRNFPMMWGHDEKTSSSNPCMETYRGPRAMSEPETRAIFDYATMIFPKEPQKGLANRNRLMNQKCPENFPGIYMDVHSHGGYIFYPWGHADISPPNREGIFALASKLAYHGDYKLWGPTSPDFLYPVSGDTTSSTYGALCVPSAGFEVGNAVFETCSHFEEVSMKVMLPALLYAARSATQAYKIPRGPDIRDIHFDRFSKKLTVVADDGEMTKFESSTVRTVRVYIDEHPYESGSQGIDMNPTSGTFSRPRERATLDLPIEGAIVQVEEIDIHVQISSIAISNRRRMEDTSRFERKLQPDTERHVVYVEAEDSEGFRGSIQAFFVDVRMSDLKPTAGSNPTPHPISFPTCKPNHGRCSNNSECCSGLCHWLIGCFGSIRGPQPTLRPVGLETPSPPSHSSPHHTPRPVRTTPRPVSTACKKFFARCQTSSDCCIRSCRFSFCW